MSSWNASDIISTNNKLYIGRPGIFGERAANLAIEHSDLLIIFAGLALLVLEFVAVPGFGVLGITGLIILFYGLYLLLIPDVPVSDEIYSAALDGFSWAIVGGIIVLIMLIRLISQSKVFQKLITKDSNKATLKDNYDKRSKV